MIAAVHVFNGAGLTFRAELFIVTAIVAWTYLLHAWFSKHAVDYRYMVQQGGKRVTVKTPNGEDKYWDLAHCIKHAKCPVEKGVTHNLNFLLEFRHEIEHRSTSRIDDVIGPKLQRAVSISTIQSRRNSGRNMAWNVACQSPCNS